MRAWVSVVLLLAAGCSRDRRCKVELTGFSEDPRGTIAFPGERWETGRIFLTGTDCDREQTQKDFKVEVFAPDDAILPVELGTPSPYLGTDDVPGRIDFEVSLAFTPQQLGLHHVLADLRESQWQFDVLVVKDRRGPPADVTTTSGRVCFNEVQRTALGTLLCSEIAGPTLVIRDGAQVESLNAVDGGVAVALGASTIWALTAEGLLRQYRDTGSGPLELLASGQAPVGPMAAADDEVVIADWTSVARFRPVDGGLEQVGRAAHAGAGPPHQVAWDADAGRAVVAAGVSWFRIAVPPGDTNAIVELKENLSLAGRTPGTLWVISFLLGVMAIPADPDRETLTYAGAAQSFRGPWRWVYTGGPPVMLNDFHPWAGVFVEPGPEGLALSYFEGVDGATIVGPTGPYLHVRRANEHYFYPR